MRKLKRKRIAHLKWRMKYPDCPLWMKGLPHEYHEMYRRVQSQAAYMHKRWLESHSLFLSPPPIIHIGVDLGREDDNTFFTRNYITEPIGDTSV